MRQIWKHYLNKKSKRKKSVKIIKSEIKGDNRLQKTFSYKKTKKEEMFSQKELQREKLEDAWKGWRKMSMKIIE